MYTNALKPEVEFLEAELSKREDEGYTEKRIALCRQLCKKDSGGNPVLDRGNFIIEDDKKAEFEEKIQALKIEYKDALEKQEKRSDELAEFIKQEVNVDLPPILLSLLPKKLVIVDKEGNELPYMDILEPFIKNDIFDQVI